MIETIAIQTKAHEIPGHVTLRFRHLSPGQLRKQLGEFVREPSTLADRRRRRSACDLLRRPGDAIAVPPARVYGTLGPAPELSICLDKSRLDVVTRCCILLAIDPDRYLAVRWNPSTLARSWMVMSNGHVVKLDESAGGRDNARG